MMSPKKSIYFKCLLLFCVGIIILFSCNLFKQQIAVEGEYHYSQLLRSNYLTFPAIMLFVITGFLVGYFWQLNPWFTGLSLYFVFPMVSLIEATIYKGSHNLIPFEFVIFFGFSLPAIIAAYLGKFVYQKS